MKAKLLILTSLILLACGSTPPKKPSGETNSSAPAEKLLKSVSPTYKATFKHGTTVKIAFQEAVKADSVQIFVDGTRLTGNEYIAKRVGKLGYKVVAYKGGVSESLSGQFTVTAATAPKMHKIRILHQYPHDPKAYTQGLLFHNGKLYESTGERGRSSVREVEISTGKVLRSKGMDRKYFGEGLALLGDKLYQLTWTEGVVFIYDLNDFEKRTELPLSGEGWGVTTDGTHLYITDGSNKITKYEAPSFKRISQIEVADDKQLVRNLNELEWIDGKIWANIYTTNLIAVIDPESGVVERYIDCSLLEKKITNYANADVLNGIAHDRATGRIWLTGKDWDTLFEVAIQ